MEMLNPADPAYYDKMEELKAMDIAADAILIYAKRYAAKLRELAKVENDAKRKVELEKMASNMR